MSNFKLSADIDNNKIFLVKRSELSGRFDPEIILYNRNVKKYKFPTHALKYFLKEKPQYGAGESGVARFYDNEPRYIRITDIDENGGLINGLGVTALTINKQYILKNNDILIARSGNTVGKSYLHKENNVNFECFFAGYMIRFIVNEEKLLPDFLFLYTQLKPYKDWVKAVQRTAGQPNINAEEYKSLPIPTPEIKTQIELIRIYNNAFICMKEKQQQAQALLASIDIYLLTELGITLPEQDNSLEKRMFKLNFSDIIGKKFSPESHKNKELEKLLKNGKYKTSNLRDITINIKTGSTPHHNLEPYQKSGIPFLRNTNLKQAELDLTDIRYIDKKLQKQLTYSYYNEVIICIAGTVGDSALNTINTPIAINQNITAIKADENKVNPSFLKDYLNTSLNIQIVKNKSSIATISYLNNSNLLALQIPLLPIQKQNEIADHIQTIRSQAKQLQTQAEQLLANAKAHIEQMILGV